MQVRTKIKNNSIIAHYINTKNYFIVHIVFNKIKNIRNLPLVIISKLRYLFINNNIIINILLYFLWNYISIKLYQEPSP